MGEKDENCINVIFYSVASHTLLFLLESWKNKCKVQRRLNNRTSAPSSPPSLTPAVNIPHWHSHLPRSPHAIVYVLPGALHCYLTPDIPHTDNTHSHSAAITCSYLYLWEPSTPGKNVFTHLTTPLQTIPLQADIEKYPWSSLWPQAGLTFITDFVHVLYTSGAVIIRLHVF